MEFSGIIDQTTVAIAICDNIFSFTMSYLSINVYKFQMSVNIQIENQRTSKLWGSWLEISMNWNIKVWIHLSWTFDALPQREIDDDEDKHEADWKLPLQTPQLVKSFRFVIFQYVSSETTSKMIHEAKPKLRLLPISVTKLSSGLLYFCRKQVKLRFFVLS